MKRVKDSRESSYPRIWRTVGRIPRGRVATYGQIATLAGLPSQARLVGYALHNTPEGMPIPWQRVINSRGTISFPRTHPHYRKQRELLEQEGVVFRGGKVDLREFGWRSSGARGGRRQGTSSGRRN